MPRAKKPEESVPHIVSEEDLINNPELVENGVKVGDEIQLPKSPKAPKSDKSEFTVDRGEDVVRTYSVEIHGPDAEKLANEFVSHTPGTEVR